MKNKKWLLLFITVVICFAMPSIIYLAKNQSIYNFIYQWTFIFKIPKTILAKWINTISFIGLMSVMFILYILIIKHSNKIFKSKKQLIIAICIISVLFALIIPYTSTDVYSYIANGWSASHYHENPYYKSVGQISDEHQVRDQMYNKVANCWRYETVVYGPFWTLICKILTSISLGKIDVALAIFKGTNLIVHLINCLLIWEITHKKKFVLIYGANPTILFEALSNVHNDIFIVLFILLAIYFVTKKKNLVLSVAFVAMATAIKYLGILILPFIILYHLRKKNILEKIKYCVLYGLEFIVILVGFYAIYVKDLNIFAGLFIQQSKYNRSIMLVFYYLIGEQSTNILKTALLAVFAILYVYTVIKLLLNNNTSNIAMNSNNEQCITTTGTDGSYMFNNVPQGKYSVIFFYDSAKYSPTTYKKSGVSEEKNSDAIDKTVNYEGKDQIAAVTEEIVLADTNQFNIDLGIVEDAKFDLKLDKVVQAITVNNGKNTKEHVYNSKLAKLDFESKYANTSSIVVEYKFTITNEGGIAGYVKKLADYLPEELKFNSELNKDWYEGKDGVIYNASLANTIINPGESKEVTLILTKNMNGDDDFGLINNSAEIYETSNDYGALDIDSTPGNKATNEDDYSTANVLTSVKTGDIVIYTTLIVTIIAIVGVGIYMIKKKVLI